MKHRLLQLLIWCFLSGSVLAQTAPSRFQLQATVTDTLGAKLNGATVMLQTVKDSVLSNYGRTNETGQFTLKGIRRGNYILKVTYVGMMPINQSVTLETEANVDLGTIKLKPIAKELYEVVIRTARAPLTIRGDTVEYNAASFKVPPGSTVEDLLRKLPGVLVDREGNIRAQGQEVKRVTVDGKQFFGDDPKMATKNLQAEAISKVQVFSGQSEKAKLTGVDDGKKEKTMNLELKEEFKKGGFGKITAGAGPATNLSARGEVRGNYNKFDQKQQLSAIGLANNTNQTGLSWADYQDFRGSNSFTRNEDADFGFGGGGGYYFSSNGDEGLSIPVNWGSRGGGLSNNMAAGVNYNFDTPKTKFSTSYYGSSSTFITETLAERKNFLQTGSFTTRDTTNQRTGSNSHRLSLRYEKKLDSLNTLVVIHNSRLNNGTQNLLNTSELLRNDLIRSTFRLTNNNGNNQAFAMANTALYRHKFKTKGRSFALSAGYNYNQNDALLNLQADLRFFDATTVNEQLRLLRQRQTTNSTVAQFKASAQYTEPLSKKLSLESFYNFSLRYDEADRAVLDKSTDQLLRVDSLSRYYTNNYTYNRVGTGLRYAYKGINVGVGGAVQRFELNGEYATDKASLNRQRLNRVFTTVIPNVSVNLDLKNNKYAYLGYNMDVRLPSPQELQPIVDNSNPLYISRGNPNLLPALSHSVYTGFNYFNPGSFLSMYGGFNYSYNINEVVYAQTVDPQTLITNTIPQNITGGQNGGFSANVSFPIKKTKLTMDVGGNLNLGRSFTPINGILNQTNATNYNVRLSIALTPAEWLAFYGGTNIGIGNTRYSLSSGQNQQLVTNNYNAEATVKLPGQVFISSSFNYQLYRNSRFAFNQGVPILNSAIYRVVGKAKKMEVRLSSFDLLNRNVGVNLDAGQNYVSQQRTRTLARYFLLSFTYNMRGVTAKVRRNDGW
ncbi:outer membrane beta-barrel protein [Fibrella sp. HMF5335]|uniref:Outer membrane beta-barrel protein n=1 Tax=Fibrella rubiginis TaxID=2817060 RepID=A0A939K784_9BACT|nr:outer membrane beta-barrel protein [Fibrella rubiginis]MBO0939131.1 outer membrane beta-barrel protein [Fibrella rubiginis]